MKINKAVSLPRVIACMAVIMLATASCDTGDSGDKTISIKVIQGVTPPVTGETPVTEIIPTAQYTGRIIWDTDLSTSQQVQSYIDIGWWSDWQTNFTKFFPDTQHIATIILYEADGYTLQGVKANFFTVPGAALVSNNANSCVVTAVFTQTGKLPTSSTFTSIDELAWYLSRIPENTADTPYTITLLNVDDLDRHYDTTYGLPPGNLYYVLYTNPTKYINLDLSGSSITNIPAWAFSDCHSLTSITLPDSVTRIGEMAFSGCHSLTSITLPNSVTSIGEGAFASSGLTSVTIPDGVTRIEDYTFNYCSSLTSVTIPDSVTSIGKMAFFACHSLTDIIIPNGVTSIGTDDPNLGNGGIFADCTSLISVTIPNSVTTIGTSAFHSCESLTSITLPDSVTTIGSDAFYGCTSLSAMNVDTGNNVFSSQDGVLYNKDKTTLIFCPQRKTGALTIPNSVTTIGEGALSGCTDLTSVTIPNSVTIIRDHAFSGCTSLTSVTLPDSVTTIGGGGMGRAFSRCTSLSSVTIPNSVTYIAANTFEDCTGLSTINVDAANTVYSSQDGVLYNKDKTILTSCPAGKTGVFTIPDSVTSIGSGAFYGCTRLTGITIPTNVTDIGSFAFYGCSRLTGITIPDSVTRIEDYTFCYCTSLTSVTFQGTISNFRSAFGYSGYDGYIGDLRERYLAGGTGTYTRASGSLTWTKQ